MKDLLQRKYANYVLKPFLQWYLKKDRSNVVNGFELKVSVGVWVANNVHVPLENCTSTNPIPPTRARMISTIITRQNITARLRW